MLSLAARLQTKELLHALIRHARGERQAVRGYAGCSRRVLENGVARSARVVQQSTGVLLGGLATTTTGLLVVIVTKAGEHGDRAKHLQHTAQVLLAATALLARGRWRRKVFLRFLEIIFKVFAATERLHCVNFRLRRALRGQWDVATAANRFGGAATGL